MTPDRGGSSVTQPAPTQIDDASLRLSEDERAGMRDMWAVYDRHYEEVSERLLESLADDPELGPLITATPEAQREEQARSSKELMRRAVLDDDWAPYLDDLRTQGKVYADLGLSLDAWYRLIASFRPMLRPMLLDAYGQDQERTMRAFEGMTRLLDIALARIGASYLQRSQETISAQTQTIEELSTTRTILASVPDGVVTTDQRGIVRTINPALERLTGWSLEESIGKPFDEVTPLLDGRGEPIPAKDQFLPEAIRTGQIVTGKGYDLLLLTRSGRRIPVAVTAAPIIDEDGQVLGGVDVLRDVSHEREVDLLKSSLISTVSHELRTPLTMIEGFAELLLTRELDAGRATHAAEQIHTSALRLDRLIEDLLSVSRIDSGSLEVRAEPVDLHGAVGEVAQAFIAERLVDIDLDGVGDVLADRDMLHRILTNLVSNAIKYSPDGGPVIVKAELADASASISITDKGIGMSPEDLTKLFGKFFRADRPEVRNARGTGLGLYITRSLVELQRGTIEVQSAPGEGTTFTFTLPLVERKGQR
jgi:PAS domain S-box-containing protein